MRMDARPARSELKVLLIEPFVPPVFPDAA